MTSKLSSVLIDIDYKLPYHKFCTEQNSHLSKLWGGGDDLDLTLIEWGWDNGSNVLTFKSNLLKYYTLQRTSVNDGTTKSSLVLYCVYCTVYIS